MSLITLTTDFGSGSAYTAMMKGVILRINPEARIVDLSHEIEAQDIRAGAMMLAEATPLFPEGTIHLAVIDPGVGTDRAILYVEVGNQRYILPDNGLISMLLQQAEAKVMLRIDNPDYWLAEVSNTFHGRDIMAPVAAHLSLGVEPGRMGVPAGVAVGLEWPQPEIKDNVIRGQVLEVDSFGNLITNISDDLLIGLPTDSRLCVVCGLYETYGVMQTYAQGLEGTLIAVIGSCGRLELAVVGDNAAERLGVGVGTGVSLGW